VGHHLGVATRTLISVCKSSFLSVPCENGSVETTVAEED